MVVVHLRRQGRRVSVNLVLDVSFEDLSNFFHDFADVEQLVTFENAYPFDDVEDLKCIVATEINEVVEGYPGKEM